jgi:hypothetical protein
MPKMESKTFIPRKRKSNFDVPPQDIPSLSISDAVFNALLLSSSKKIESTNESPGEYTKDLRYEARIRNALQKNFDFIKKYISKLVVIL